MKTLPILTAAAIALAFSAGSSLAKDKVTVAFIAKGLESTFWVTATKGAESAAQSDPNITVVTAAGTDESAIEEQIAKVESMIVRHVDAIAIAPTAPDQLIPVLQKVVDTGIPIVLVDTNIPSFSAASSYVGTDNVNGGRKAAEFIRSQLPNGGKIALISGTPGVTSTDDRIKGCREGLEGSNITVVAELASPGNARDGGVTAMQDILTAHPDVNAVFAAGDEPALGAAEAMRAHGISLDKIVLVGFDGSPNGIASIKIGELKASIAQFPAQMGKLGVLTAATLARGGKASARIDTGVVVITKGNVADFGD